MTKYTFDVYGNARKVQGAPDPTQEEHFLEAAAAAGMSGDDIREAEVEDHTVEVAPMSPAPSEPVAETASEPVVASEPVKVSATNPNKRQAWRDLPVEAEPDAEATYGSGEPVKSDDAESEVMANARAD